MKISTASPVHVVRGPEHVEKVAFIMDHMASITGVKYRQYLRLLQVCA